MAPALRSALAASLFLSWAASAEAQPTTRPVLVGERALGMAGATTASARGPSAAYYNPAGLTATDQTAVGGSLSLRTFRSYGIADGYRSSVGIEDLDDATLDSTSVFLGGLIAFGDRLELGSRQHALAAGTLVANGLDISFTDTAADVRLDRASALDVERERVDRWYYLAYSFRPSSELSFGLTAALSARSEQYRESISDGGGLTMDAVPARLTARDVELEASAFHLVLRAGFQARLVDWLQLGLVFQAPGIPLASSGRATFQRLTVEDPDSSLFRRVWDDVDAGLPAPWSARVGLYARVHPDLGLALEGGMRGRIGSVNDPWLVLGRTLPIDGGQPAATYYAAERVADFAFDAALGAELDVWDEVPIRAGVFWAGASEATIDGPSAVYPMDSVSELGGTLSVGFHDPHYDFTIGVSYAYGWGTGARPNPDPAGLPYVPTSIESNEILVILSGVTGAAAELALEAYNAVTSSEDEEAREELREDREELAEEERAERAEERAEDEEPPTEEPPTR